MLPRLRFLILIAWCGLSHQPVTSWCQSTTAPPNGPPPLSRRTVETTAPDMMEKTKDQRPVFALASPLIADPGKYPVPPSEPQPPPPSLRLFQDTRFDITGLPRGGDHGLGITDLELATTLNLLFQPDWSPLRITPYAAAHYWEAPTAASNPDLPAHLYDLNVEFAWRPRVAPWLFLDLAVTPGLYTDFKEVNADSFQMRGRGLAIVALSPQWQFAGGLMYVNRNQLKVLPAGGVIWNPDEDTRCFLVFPQPKVSTRMRTLGVTQLWGYVAGEFGGGRWEVETANGAAESIDYTDVRVVVGLEAIRAQRWQAHCDIGYVFARRVDFISDLPDYRPHSTLMLRGGIRY